MDDASEEGFGIEQHSPGFLDVEGMGVLSIEAFQLHSFATVESVRSGEPGFVSDDYLNAISAETTVAVAELEASGLWERRDGGYLIMESKALKAALDFKEETARSAAACRARGFHLPDEDDGPWVICLTCGAPLKRPDSKPVAGADGSAPDYGPHNHDELGKPK